ncbi:MAG: putative sulfate exporter family transporter [Opitutaceae bacterium]|nr:putative sulfate exporter family transporter [Opitutaceae bacterium]
MNVIITPETSRSWNGMEGVPDELEAVVAYGGGSMARPPSSARATGHRWLELIGNWLPGVALAAALAWLAESGARWIGSGLFGYSKSPINGVPVAIVFGLVICNAFGVPAGFKAGLRLCASVLLRTAIVLLGLRLSLGMAAGIGWQALPVVAVCIAAALVLVPWLGSRAGLPPRLAALISVGTGICGVTAIVATAPAIGAKEDEVSYAVACVAIFGLIAMLLHPWLAHLMFAADVRSVGIFLGTAIHDTSQVAGAALTYEARYHAPEALNVATVTKLMRNLCLAGAIPLMAWRYARAAAPSASARPPWHVTFPLFVLGFVAMSILRTIGDASPRAFGILEPGQWHRVLSVTETVSAAAITMVMAAIGLQTDFSRFRRLGVRPLLVGFGAALAVGAVSVVVLLLTRQLFGS